MLISEDDDDEVSNDERSNEEKSIAELRLLLVLSMEISRQLLLVLSSGKEGMVLMMGRLASNSAVTASLIPRSPAAGASPP